MAIPVHFFRWLQNCGAMGRAPSIVLLGLLSFFQANMTLAASQYEGGRNSFGRYQGMGTLTQSNGKEYRGYWQDGRRDGQGTQVLSNGERYTGSWKNNKPHGNGTKAFANGDRYEGEWSIGKMNGYAVYSYANGDVYEGQFENGLINGNGKLVRVTDDTFTGNWIDGELAGVGAARLANGDQYWGSFKAWNFHGIGEMVFANGENYRGSFAQGKVHGRGVYHYRNGDIYKGRFIWGVRFGRGVLTDQRGNSYDGHWREDSKNGAGEERLIIGEHYIGEFSAGKRHGKGLLVDSDGISYEGYWKEGRLSGDALVTFQDGNTFAGHVEEGLPHGIGECEDGAYITRCEFEQGQRLLVPAKKVVVKNIAHDEGEVDLTRARTPSFGGVTHDALPKNTKLVTANYHTFVSFEHGFSDQPEFYTQQGISLNYDKNKNKLEVIASADGYWLRLYVPNYRGAGVYQLLSSQAETGDIGSEYYQTSDDFPGVIRITESKGGVLKGRFEFFAYRQNGGNIAQGQHIRKGQFLIDRTELEHLKRDVGPTHSVADVLSPLMQ